MMKRELGIGLVGYKFMGKAHTNGYRQMNMFMDPGARVRLKVLCGRDGDWLRKNARQFGFEGFETDWRALCKREDVDAVDITTPSNYHADIAIAAAESKKHVFCEKPMALALADARAMLKAAEDNGVKHQVGFNYRFAPAVRLAKKLIDGGALGTIYHFRALYLQDWIIDPGFPRVWRLDKSICGSGSLGDLGAHIIDLGRYLAGEYKQVIGLEKTFVKQRPLVERMEGLSGAAGAGAPLGSVDVDDATVFLMEFENGAIGSIEATRFAAGHDNDMLFEINGSKGSIRYRFERMNELEFFSREDDRATAGWRNIATTHSVHDYMPNWWPPGHVIGYEHTFTHELYEFVQAIANGAETSPSFHDGVKNAEVIEAVEQSIRNRCWINISEV
jgi:predicted dehydrogenase